MTAKLKINERFADTLKPLSADEESELRKSIKADGVIQPIMVWKGHQTIVDGHNRHRIATEEGVPFKTVQRDFPDEDAVIRFILVNQLARRNIPLNDRTYYMGLLYGQRKQTSAAREEQGGDTADQMAEEFNVSASTVRRAENYAKGVDLLDSGQVELTKELEAVKEKLDKRSILDKKAPITKATVEHVGKTGELPKERKDVTVAVKPQKAPTVKSKPEKPKKTFGMAFVMLEARPSGKNDTPELVNDIDKPPFADDATCYFHVEDWAAPLAFDLMFQWGLTFAGSLILRVPQDQQYESYMSNCRHEFLFVATKGVPDPLPAKAVTESVVDTNDVPATAKKIVEAHADGKEIHW